MIQVNLITKQTNPLINIIKKIEKLLGIRNINNSKDFNRLINTGWVFISGLPIGFILFNNTFSIPIWLCICGGMLIIYNLFN